MLLKNLRRLGCFLAVLLCAAFFPARSVAAETPPGTNEVRLVQLQGSAEVSLAGTTSWTPASTNTVLRHFDRLRTGPNARISLRWSDQSVISFGPSTILEVLPPHEPEAESGLRLIEGIVSFFHREKPGRIRIVARGAVAGVEGTEFVVEAAPASAPERTTLSVIDGRVRFGNDFATLVLTNGQQAVVEQGQPPRLTPGFVVNQVLQWAFYYPAVLDPAELELTAAERDALAASLTAYASGDLVSALRLYPQDRVAASDAERVYFAALLLAVGQVSAAETALASLTAADESSRPQRLARALRRLVATVNQTASQPLVTPTLATELLAESYATQAQARRGESLEAALDLALTATTNSPAFGFAWARTAELEFSFGRAAAAQAALDRALELAPLHAQALALQGFTLTARNRTRDALPWFNRAIAADGSLANAWLGRGLSRIRLGDLDAGREDLLVAAALEPRRAELRNYLGKAFAEDDQPVLAAKEVALAQELDPNDPNTWLYSALLHQQNNEINAAIRDLEKSQDLNDNRSLFRSDYLLNQDEAVRSANLARIYQDAGLNVVAQREAARAVNADYGNYATHEFLAANLGYANEHPQSRRFSTATVNEYAIANLLAPVHAGILSPAISQSEYSGLFARNRMGVYSSTEYLDRGAWNVGGGQYGVFDTFSYDLFGQHFEDPGQIGIDHSRYSLFSATVKLQASPNDTLLFDIDSLSFDSGYLPQPYDPATFSGIRARQGEDQDANLTLGLNHEWAPGVNTLIQFGRSSAKADFYGQRANSLLLVHVIDGFDIPDPLPPPGGVFSFGANTWNSQKHTLYSADLQQIWQQGNHATIVGARFAAADHKTSIYMTNPDGNALSYFGVQVDEPIVDQSLANDSRQSSLYLYQHWQPVDSLRLIGGLAYVWQEYPTNIWTVPATSGLDSTDHLSPKAGLIWTPLERSTVRFAYTRSLQGSAFINNNTLEPTQVAGFVQRFTVITPEAVAGPSNGGAEFETLDLSLEQKFETGTYLGLGLQRLSSTEDRTVGGFRFIIPDGPLPPILPIGIRQELDYLEHSLHASIHQLLGDEWSLGADYRVSHADLDSIYPYLPPDIYTGEPGFDYPIEISSSKSAVLHHLRLSALFNHRGGFFAGIDGNWYSQDSEGYSPGLPGDDLWQGNLHLGYRFLRRRAEVRVSLLNFNDQDYRLNPLNLHNNLPRERTLAVRLQFGF